MTVDLSAEFVAMLRKLAAQPLLAEDEEFEVHSYSGGNVDDAFEMGVDEGRRYLAQEIVALLPEEE